MKRYNVTKSGIRLDIYLIDLIPELTRSKIQLLIKNQQILINDNPTKPSYILKGDETISYKMKSSSNNINKDILPENISLNVIHEDSSIIVLNKAPGMVVHPGAGNYSGTLLNAVIEKIDQSDFDSTPGIVHRLDKETSGVIIVAKNFSSHNFISNQFQNRSVKKIYKALVWGKCSSKGNIRGNIIRNNKNRKTMILTDSDNGRYSETDYELIDFNAPISLVKLKPLTGRTHQIRVHMKSIGHPILSDQAYSGGDKMIKSFHVKYSRKLKRALKEIPRVALHAESIQVIHPETGDEVEFSAKIPDDFNNAIAVLQSDE